MLDPIRYEVKMSNGKLTKINIPNYLDDILHKDIRDNSTYYLKYTFKDVIVAKEKDHTKFCDIWLLQDTKSTAASTSGNSGLNSVLKNSKFNQ